MADDNGGPISFRRLVAFHAIQFYYTAPASFLFTFFILPKLGAFVSNLFWDVFVEKRLSVIASIVCLAVVVRYLFRNDDEYVELADQPVYQPEDLTFPPPDLQWYPQ